MVRRNSLLLGIIVLLAVMAFVGLAAFHVKAQPSSVTIQATATATTTGAFMTPGTATTTYQFDSQTFSSGKIPSMLPVDSGTMNVAFAASTSAAVLEWQFQGSNNGIDWYGENASGSASLSGSSITEASTSITHIWTPGNTTATTTYKNFTVPIFNTYHERVVFFIPNGVSSTNGTVYAEIQLKKNPSTP